MLWPLLACLVLPWLLVYLGLHIVQRGVIFVDLALAQTAAFGTCVAMFMGYDVHDWQSYVCSLGFTMAGADRKFHEARARITHNTVIVTCDATPHPQAVRFGWANYPLVNLWNKEGLPAHPFRSDDWEVTHQHVK